MPNYIVQPQSDHTNDPNDLTNAVFAFGVSDPGTISGLTNDIAYVARELIASPASTAFTPAAVGSGVAYSDDFSTDTSARYVAVVGTGAFSVSGGELSVDTPVYEATITEAAANTLNTNHFVRGTIQNKNGQQIILMANIAATYGDPGTFDQRVWLQWQGAGNFTMNWDGNTVTGAAGSVSSGDVVELRITGNGTLATARVNGVDVPNMTDVDVSSLTPNGRVGLGLQGSWAYSLIEAGNI